MTTGPTMGNKNLKLRILPSSHQPSDTRCLSSDNQDYAFPIGFVSFNLSESKTKILEARNVWLAELLFSPKSSRCRSSSPRYPAAVRLLPCDYGSIYHPCISSLDNLSKPRKQLCRHLYCTKAVSKFYPSSLTPCPCPRI
jgi:hypothetical protein